MKLSIITINYNNCIGLSATIKTVVSQTWKNFEFIIIDGKSSDDSKNIIKKHESCISYWVSEKDDGVYHAMNKGIAKATGEYLLMLNSGDILASTDTLGTVFSQQDNTEDILYGNVTWLKENKFFTQSNFPAVLTFKYFWYKSLGHQAAFIRRSVHHEAGLYDETFHICSDWKLFLLAIFKYGATYKHLNSTIALCDCTGLSWNSENFALMDLEKQQVLQEYFPLFYDDYKELETYKKNTLQNKFENFKKSIKGNIKQMLGYKK